MPLQSRQSRPRPSRSRPRRWVAVDWSRQAIWLVEGEPKGQQASIKRIVSIALPEGLDTQDAAAMGRFLADSIQRHKMQGLPLLMALPRRVAVLRQLSLPANVPDDELIAMARFQVQKDLPFDPAEAVIDILPGDTIGDGAQRLVLAGVARRDSLTFFTDMAAAGKLTLAGVGLSSACDRACLSACEPTAGEAHAMLVHLAVQCAEVDLLQPQGPSLNRSLTCGDLADAAARADLLDELARVVQSHRATHGDAGPASVRLVGGTGHEAALLADLRRHRTLKELDAAIIDPAQAMNIKAKGDAPVGGACTAVGLIITRSANADFDFLHPADEDPHRQTRILRRRLGVLAAASLVFAVVAGSLLMLQQRRSTLRDMQDQYARLQAENKLVVALGKRVRAVQAWQDEQRPWLDHWALLSSLLPAAPDVYITAVTTRPGGGIQFTVKATRSQAITELARRLQDAGYDFQPGQVATASDRFGYPFSADIRLSAPAKMTIDAATLAAPLRPEDDASLQRIHEEPQRQRRRRP